MLYNKPSLFCCSSCIYLLAKARAVRPLIWVWLSSYVSDIGGDDDTVGINIAGNDCF